MTISPSGTTGIRTAVLRLGAQVTENADYYCAKITSTNNHSKNYLSDLRFYTYGGNANDGDPIEERMCITSSGNVGIGTTSPSYNLDLTYAGEIRTGKIHLFNDQATIAATANTLALFGKNAHGGIGFYTTDTTTFSDAKMYIINNGNVGIGTTSPTTALTIRKAIDTGTATTGLYGKHASMIEFKSYYPGLGYHEEAVLSAIHSGVSAKNFPPDYGLASNAGFMAFHVHDGSAMKEKLRIEKHGELVLPSGIGPKINLGYGIGFSIENLLLKYKVNTTDRHGFFVDDYEVAKFSKNGAEFGTEITSVMIGYQVGHNNNGNGYDSTKQLNPAGSVIIGRHAGYATSSKDNVAVGMNALANSTKSGVGDNVAIGRSALTGATQDGNVAIGAYAGASITGYSTMGRSNVLIGYTSGYQNDSGQITGNNLITGRYNTLIGPYTHTTKSDVQYSSAIGYNAHVTKNHQIVLGKTSATLPDVYIPGKLGIGTDSPSQKLDVVGNAEITGNVTVGTYGRKSDVFTVNGYTKYMGQSSDYAFIGLDESTTNAGRLIISTHDDAGANEDICLMPGCQSNAFPTSGATVNGHVGIGTLNPDTLLHVAGDAKATSFNATSDYRVKENVQTISGEIYTVDNLRPVSYHLKDSKEPHIGFIAHELQEHVPTAVKGEKDGEEMQSVNYSELIPILVKEIQDLKKEVRMLKERIKEH